MRGHGAETGGEALNEGACFVPLRCYRQGVRTSRHGGGSAKCVVKPRVILSVTKPVVHDTNSRISGHDVNFPNRPLPTRMPGGVAGVQPSWLPAMSICLSEASSAISQHGGPQRNPAAAVSPKANVHIGCRQGCAADVAEVQQKSPSALRQSGAGLLKPSPADKLGTNHPDGFARLADELGERTFLAYQTYRS